MVVLYSMMVEAKVLPRSLYGGIELGDIDRGMMEDEEEDDEEEEGGAGSAERSTRPPPSSSYALKQALQEVDSQVNGALAFVQNFHLPEPAPPPAPAAEEEVPPQVNKINVCTFCFFSVYTSIIASAPLLMNIVLASWHALTCIQTDP